jgi:predicted AAA+ superfamily ATPase
MEEVFLHLKELNQLYDEYLITGGIPLAINAYVSDSTITKDIYEGYVELLLRDIRRWGGNDDLMRQIVRRVTDTMGSPVSLHNLQEETEISSHNTVTSYLDYLKDSFVLMALYRLDQARGSPIYKGEKKIYFEDPFIFHALRSWSIGAEPYEGTIDYLKNEEDLGRLTESVVANHLVRLLFGYSPSTQFDYTNLLFFSRSKRKRELDFAAKQLDHYLPMEVKYQGKIRSEDGFGIIDFQKGGNASNGLLLTRDSLESRRSYIEMPVSVFLLLV